MWATRCMHEARQHDHNCFITLTYDEKHLPPDLSLKLSDWQKFMKRLRKHAKKDLGIDGIKFLHSAEYGDQEKRPHYHACIFGYDVPDRKFFKKNHNGDYLYTSNVLDILWGKGFSTIGNLTYESAAYCARYALKKINGERAQQTNPKTGLRHYERCHLQTGEILEVLPEYSTMSRNPGLGKDHATLYMDDYYPWDEIIVNGHPTRPPRYYDDLYELREPEQMEIIRQRRVETMQEHADNNTRARLSAREKVKEAQANKLIRDL